MENVEVVREGDVSVAYSIPRGYGAVRINFGGGVRQSLDDDAMIAEQVAAELKLSRSASSCCLSWNGFDAVSADSEHQQTSTLTGPCSGSGWRVLRWMPFG